jgi:hypothetical protein
VRVVRSLTLVLLPVALTALAGCSGLVFESMPGTPEAVLAFKLRTLEPGRGVRIQRLDGSMVEGRVVEPAPGRAILETELGQDTVAAEAVGAIWLERAPVGRSVGRSALGAALGVAAVIAFLYGAYELSGADAYGDTGPIWYLTPLVAKAAVAGGVFGAVVHAASPGWYQVYPVPAGARP